jgi:ethanolaminephosphotransferase
VYLTLAISFVTYVRFCSLVIDDITNYMGIGCFVVRKKDSEGVWQKAGNVPMSKKQVNGNVP